MHHMKQPEKKNTNKVKKNISNENSQEWGSKLRE